MQGCELLAVHDSGSHRDTRHDSDGDDSDCGNLEIVIHGIDSEKERRTPAQGITCADD